MNPNKAVYDPPLLKLFNRLRQAGLPLGIDEYKLLLYALQGGYGLPDRSALLRLCKMLWIKSVDEERLLEYHFEQVMAEVKVDETLTEPSQQLLNYPKKEIKDPFYKRIWLSIKRLFQSISFRRQPITTSSESTSESSMTTPSPITTPPMPVPQTVSNSVFTPSAELTLKIEDEVQVARAVLQTTTSQSDYTDYNYFIQTDEYFPITRRQMKQSWRYMRRLVREGPPVELDVEATMNEIGRQGFLHKPVLVPRRINRTELLLLMDHDGSMVPFHSLSRRLAETAIRGGRLGKTDIYYFHNYPSEYLYRDFAHQEPVSLESVLNHLSQRHASILIFSDAGAARGGFNNERAEMTKEYLARLKQRVRYVAWLNPMPRSRWPGTTAGEVMLFVPMFDVSRRGLDDGISVLRGRSIPYQRNKATV